MSEYASPWAAERLLAKDDGTPSDFVENVRQQPFVVVLLDEIEKAAAPVFDMLLGVLDEGRLTDRNGRTTIFRSAIVILTSNLGAATRSSIGFDPAAAQGYAKAVQDFFRPELFNRIDAVVSFGPLDATVCRSIVRKEIGEIALREGLKRAGVRLRASDALVDQLVAAGFDPRYGARPLQRTLETRLVTHLSRFLLEFSGLHGVEIELDTDSEGGLIIR
jgi:ATP-dependent Clp protease ATP-binding subunit ClpC